MVVDARASRGNQEASPLRVPTLTRDSRWSQASLRQASRSSRQASRLRRQVRFFRSDLPTLSACLPTAYLPIGLPAASAARPSSSSLWRHALLLAALFACVTLLAACEATQRPQPKAPSATDAGSAELHVEIDGDVVTVRAYEARLGDIIEEIARHAGLELLMHAPLAERVDADLRLPLREALRQLLQEHDFALQQTTQASRSGALIDESAGRLWIFARTSQHDASASTVLASDDPIEEAEAIDADERLARLRVALVDANANTRLDAVSALAELTGEQTAALLTAAALHDADPSVRAEAVYALSAGGDDGRSSESLQRALLDPSPRVREAAVRAFEDIGGERSAQSLAVALKDADASVRAAAVDALSEIGGPTAARLLRTASTDENSAVREAAIEALDEAPAPSRKAADFVSRLPRQADQIRRLTDSPRA
jgi:HEAT repeats